jgi:chaperonin cofactor prefoldin
MKKNQQSPQGSGKSYHILTEVPEPDQIASGSTLTEPDNTSYSGMMGNMILFLAYRQDQVAKRLNTKIERLDQRLTVLEERERAK